MARCPNCGYKLTIIDVKAECPVCKVNIPNFNWEDRLEEDAENAAVSFKSFRRSTGAFKKCVFGSKFRIARFVLTFAPLLFLLFPMFTVETTLPFSQGKENFSMLSIILDIVNGEMDIGTMLNFTSFEFSGAAFTLLYISLILVVLGIVAGVLNFFVLLISGFSYHAKGNIVLCLMSMIFFIGAICCIVASSFMFASSIPEVVTVKLSYSLFIGLICFTINFIMNWKVRLQFAQDKRELGRQIREEEGITV